MFRLWIGALAVALIAVTAVPTAVHAAHGADQECAVCTPGSQPLADLSSELKVRPTEAAETLAETLRISWVHSHRGARIPARAPPLSVFPA